MAGSGPTSLSVSRSLLHQGDLNREGLGRITKSPGVHYPVTGHLCWIAYAKKHHWGATVPPWVSVLKKLALSQVTGLRPSSMLSDFPGVFLQFHSIGLWNAHGMSPEVPVLALAAVEAAEEAKTYP